MDLVADFYPHPMLKAHSKLSEVSCRAQRRATDSMTPCLSQGFLIPEQSLAALGSVLAQTPATLVSSLP